MLSTKEISTRESAAFAVEYLNDLVLRQVFSGAETVELLGLQPGMTVAELGAGDGRLTRSISEAVGPAGHVFAIENAPVMLVRLNETCRSQRNIHLVESPFHETPLAGDSCDRVLMAHVWAKLPDPMGTLCQAARLLREPGRLLLIEWRADVACPPGPQPQERIGFREMVQLLEMNRWDIHNHGETGPYSYFLEAAKSDESVQS
jgi:ubiquinone/menaquinone biosynthesis C-methylase UbiE